MKMKSRHYTEFYHDKEKGKPIRSCHFEPLKKITAYEAARCSSIIATGLRAEAHQRGMDSVRIMEAASFVMSYKKKIRRHFIIAGVRGDELPREKRDG